MTFYSLTAAVTIVGVNELSTTVQDSNKICSYFRDAEFISGFRWEGYK